VMNDGMLSIDEPGHQGDVQHRPQASSSPAADQRGWPVS